MGFSGMCLVWTFFGGTLRFLVVFCSLGVFYHTYKVLSPA